MKINKIMKVKMNMMNLLSSTSIMIEENLQVLYRTTPMMITCSSQGSKLPINYSYGKGTTTSTKPGFSRNKRDGE